MVNNNGKLYNEIFEIVLVLNEGMEIGIEENEYSDYVNEQTFNVIKEMYNEMEILLKTIYKLPTNSNICGEKYMETVMDEVYSTIKYQYYKLNTDTIG